MAPLAPEFMFQSRNFDLRRGPREHHEYQVGVSGLTMVPTDRGFKQAGEVFPGDSIFDSEGALVEVRDVIQQPADEMVEFFFKNGHMELGINQRVDSKTHHASNVRPWSAGALSSRPECNLLPVPVSLELTEKNLAVPPYLLGLWLGDGSKGQPNITVGDQDLRETSYQLELRGVPTHVLKGTPGKASRIGFSNRQGFSSEMGTDLAKAFRKLPCYRDKHIPEEYLWAGTEQRIELLKGLMDSDGCCSQSGYNIFAGTEDMCFQVKDLLVSLGQYASVAIQEDPRARQGFTAVTRFQSLHGLVPYSLPRKATRVVPSKRMNHRYDWAERRQTPTQLFAFVTQESSDYLVGSGCYPVKAPIRFEQSRHYS